MRKKTLWLLGISLLFLILVTVLGIVWVDAAQQVDFARKNLPPGTGGLFGTDWMGRDMLKRTVAGLSLSIRLGLLTAAISAAGGIDACIAGVAWRGTDGFIGMRAD